MVIRVIIEINKKANGKETVTLVRGIFSSMISVDNPPNIKKLMMVNELRTCRALEVFIFSDSIKITIDTIEKHFLLCAYMENSYNLECSKDITCNTRLLK